MLLFIDLHKQQLRIRPQIEAAIRRILDHDKYIMGPEVFDLEFKLAEFVKSKHCISCSSGTDALLLALLAYGIGPGDAVLTPFTFFATAEVISLLGARPVFVDIHEDTYNIDPAKIEDVIQHIKEKENLNLRGIIPVDIFGLPADYDSILLTAQKNNLFVLQDAAQAFGSVYKKKTCPTLGNIGATSFFPAKPLGCYGDGGAVFTEDDELADIIRSLREHGKDIGKYDNVRIGLNGRMDTIQAAVLLEKLKIYPEEIQLRQKVAQQYTNQIMHESINLKIQKVSSEVLSVYAQFCVEAPDRNRIVERLRENDIPSAVYYPKPLHLLPVFKHLGYHQGDLPVAEKVSQHILALPMHPYLESDQIASIIDVIRTEQMSLR